MVAIPGSLLAELFDTDFQSEPNLNALDSSGTESSWDFGNISYSTLSSETEVHEEAVDGSLQPYITSDASSLVQLPQQALQDDPNLWLFEFFDEEPVSGDHSQGYTPMSPTAVTPPFDMEIATAANLQPNMNDLLGMSPDNTAAGSWTAPSSLDSHSQDVSQGTFSATTIPFDSPTSTSNYTEEIIPNQLPQWSSTYLVESSASSHFEQDIDDDYPLNTPADTVAESWTASLSLHSQTQDASQDSSLEPASVFDFPVLHNDNGGSLPSLAGQYSSETPLSQFTHAGPSPYPDDGVESYEFNDFEEGVDQDDHVPELYAEADPSNPVNNFLPAQSPQLDYPYATAIPVLSSSSQYLSDIQLADGEFYQSPAGEAGYEAPGVKVESDATPLLWEVPTEDHEQSTNLCHHPSNQANEDVDRNVPDALANDYESYPSERYLYQGVDAYPLYPVGAGLSDDAKDFHDTQRSQVNLTLGNPVASSSRRTLEDIQPGQGQIYRPSAAEFAFDTSGVQMEPENVPVIPGVPAKHRQRHSKKNRQHPYTRAKKDTRRCDTSSSRGGPATSSNTPGLDLQLEAAKIRFRNSQAITCLVPVNGQPCRMSIKTAKYFYNHISSPINPIGGDEDFVPGHGVRSGNTSTTNAHLDGVCPYCNKRVNSSIHRHLMSDFYRFGCPAEGCESTFSRPDQLKGHCRKTHRFDIPDNQDFAVRIKNP